MRQRVSCLSEVRQRSSNDGRCAIGQTRTYIL
ncbi:MAG: hypothetical protein EOO81_08635 [Oxalobacteraceae bacterium]|nr:MAG: hypothetical protein EOO81_08635 [Oxalobacteraceae bacterium]